MSQEKKGSGGGGQHGRVEACRNRQTGFIKRTKHNPERTGDTELNRRSRDKIKQIDDQ